MTKITLTENKLRKIVAETIRKIMSGGNHKNIYDITFVSYGTDNYSKDKFEQPSFVERNNKPKGGLWGSPIDSKYGWGEWCKDNEFHVMSLDNHVLFKIKKGYNIYVIDNESDLNKISKKIPVEYYRMSEMVDELSSKYKNAPMSDIINAVNTYLMKNTKMIIDFDLLKNNYDGVFVTNNAVRELRHVPNGDGLYSWDVESICVFNPDAIEIIPENAFDKTKLPSYEDGDGFISDTDYNKPNKIQDDLLQFFDYNPNKIKMDFKRKQMNKDYQLYGNQNIKSDSSELFNGEHPGILAQGHGNDKKTKLSRKYNGTIKSGL